MGMAILPARLREELSKTTDIIKQHIAETDSDKAINDICRQMDADESLASHTDWIRQILPGDIDELRENYKKDADALTKYIRQETGTVFSHVLENAGVFKLTAEGHAGFERFISQIGSIS